MRVIILKIILIFIKFFIKLSTKIVILLILMGFFILIIYIFAPFSECFEPFSLKKYSPNYRFKVSYVFEHCGGDRPIKQGRIIVLDTAPAAGDALQKPTRKAIEIYVSDKNLVHKIRWESDRRLIIVTDEAPAHVFRQKTQIADGTDIIDIVYLSAALEPSR